jgi:hypothetical protein
MVARTGIMLGYTCISCLVYFKASDGDYNLSVESSPFQNVSYKTRHNVRFDTTFYMNSWSTVTYSRSTEHTLCYKLQFSLEADVTDLQNKNCIPMTRTGDCVQLMCLMYIASGLEQCTTNCYLETNLGTLYVSSAIPRNRVKLRVKFTLTQLKKDGILAQLCHICYFLFLGFVCSVFRALIRCIFFNTATNTLQYMSVTIFCSNHRQVAATGVTIL